jgi:MoaA/NifB/PqqE/SkfB family radical SAM enzyme
MEIKNLSHQMAENAVSVVVLTGGELLLRNDGLIYRKNNGISE